MLLIGLIILLLGLGFTLLPSLRSVRAPSTGAPATVCAVLASQVETIRTILVEAVPVGGARVRALSAEPFSDFLGDAARAPSLFLKRVDSNSLGLIGYVGIGTATPGSQFENYDTGAQTVSYTSALIDALDTSSTASINKIGMDIESTGTWNGTSAVNTGLIVNTTGGTTNYAATFNGGNVGIGTASPATNLEVYGTGAAPSLSSDTGEFKVSGTSTQELAFGEYTAGPFAFWMQTKKANNNGTAWPLVLNPLGGNVGINTTAPQVSLDVTGSIAAGTVGTEDELNLTRLLNSGVSYPQIASFQVGTYNVAYPGPYTRLDIDLKAAANGTLTADKTVMTLQSNGSVGIGFTSPFFLSPISATTRAIKAAIQNFRTRLDCHRNRPQSGGNPRASPFPVTVWRSALA